jgi:hypothetical protein
LSAHLDTTVADHDVIDVRAMDDRDHATLNGQGWPAPIAHRGSPPSRSAPGLVADASSAT